MKEHYVLILVIPRVPQDLSSDERDQAIISAMIQIELSGVWHVAENGEMTKEGSSEQIRDILTFEFLTGGSLIDAGCLGMHYMYVRTDHPSARQEPEVVLLTLTSVETKQVKWLSVGATRRPDGIMVATHSLKQN